MRPTAQRTRAFQGGAPTGPHARFAGGRDVRGVPTERQAALAARQLHYHRRRLRWIEARMLDNEALLFSYLTRADTDATVLPGGYRVTGGSASPDGDVVVARLVSKSPYEQLVLNMVDRETCRGGAFRAPPAGEEPRKVSTEGGPH